MRIWISILLFLCAACLGQAGTNFAPVRLALLVEEPSALPAGDILTAELSKRDGIQLLDRAEIETVYREYQIAAANPSYIKLGQILGAEGLLFLEAVKEGTNRYLETRLVAAKPGVIVDAIRSPWPVADPSAWADWIAHHF